MSEINNGKELSASDNGLDDIQDAYTRLCAAVRVAEPDKEKTVELLRQAKGGRSYRQFAAAMSVNVSSVSRALCGKITELSPSFLAKIAANAAENSGVTLEDLMAAQGLGDPKTERNMDRIVDAYRRLFLDGLLLRGYSVKSCSSELERAVPFLSPWFDFRVTTNALEEENSTWLIDCLSPSTGPRSDYLQNKLARAMGFYYQGGIANRISFLMDSRDVFEKMKHILSKITIPDAISVILVSPKRGRILEECIAPLTGGRIPKQVFERIEEPEEVF